VFGLDFIKKLKPCKWRYRDQLDDGVEHFGFIAQDVDKIAPHTDYGFVKTTPDGIYLINYAEFIGPIVKAMQEMEKRLTQVEGELLCHK